MVVKTELCAFSEYRIYPGHGQRYIRRDGQPVLLSTSKCKRLYIINKKKPAKLMWTQAWRRLNKKGKDEGIVKKKARKLVKVQRAIVGTSLEDLMKKKLVSKPKSAPTEAALKEVKERAKAAKKTASVVKGVAPPTGANIPKIQKSTTFNARGGSKR
mmetsp:Transcript_1579/g.2200  ORF Transcript_1579/g.2200 Transcript_1579/m.2200 type:complete len:157 (+) Transcript_1579:58-528(+)